MNAKVAEIGRGKEGTVASPGLGLALKALGIANPHVVALDGDVKNSTYAVDFSQGLTRSAISKAGSPNRTWFPWRPGCRAAGKIAFVSTFGRFIERAFDQVEMAIISGANLKLVGTTSASLSPPTDRAKMALADMASMRALRPY